MTEQDDLQDILNWAERWRVPIHGGEILTNGLRMIYVDEAALARIARSDLYWFNQAKKLADELNEVQSGDAYLT